MSYTVLARRYRSGTFDEVVGQEHVAQTLKKAIASDRVAHAYLFNGTRGVGKTSMARIMAKALNCASSDRPTTEPCGTCDSCVRVARGDDMDVIEIDAASNTGVDNVREIIENAQYRPSRSRFKIYIIDEVHMLSKAAFNALLKTMEEPPSHVKFILATTEPEKVLPTILSRCQRYDFRNIPTREIARHLKDVCRQEQVEADDAALLLVAKAGAGSMRDALSLLDRLLSIGERHLTVDLIEQLLGLPKSQLVYDLAQSIGEGDVKSTLHRANAMVQAGLSVDSFIAALVEHLRNLLIIRTCGIDSELVEVPGLAPADLAAQAERFDPVALTQDVTILEELRRHVRHSQAGRALLDATLVRMALSDQFTSVGDLLARLDGGGMRTARPAGAAAAAQKKKPGDVGATPVSPVAHAADLSPARAPMTTVAAGLVVGHAPTGDPHGPSARPGSQTPAPPAPQTTRDGLPAAPAIVAPPPMSDLDLGDDGDDDLPAVGRVWEGTKVSLGELMKQDAAKRAAAAPTPAPAPPEPNVEPVNANDLPGVWQALLALLSTNGAAGLHGLLANGRLVAIEDGRAVIRYGHQHEALVRMFDRNGKKEQVRDAFSQVLNQSLGVHFEVDADEGAADAAPVALKTTAVGRPPTRAAGVTLAPAPPPPAPVARVTPEMVQTLRENEPLVRALMDSLGAQVIKVE